MRTQAIVDQHLEKSLQSLHLNERVQDPLGKLGYQVSQEMNELEHHHDKFDIWCPNRPRRYIGTLESLEYSRCEFRNGKCYSEFDRGLPFRSLESIDGHSIGLIEDHMETMVSFALPGPA